MYLLSHYGNHIRKFTLKEKFISVFKRGNYLVEDFKSSSWLHLWTKSIHLTGLVTSASCTLEVREVSSPTNQRPELEHCSIRSDQLRVLSHHWMLADSLFSVNSPPATEWHCKRMMSWHILTDQRNCNPVNKLWTILGFGWYVTRAWIKSKI